VNQVAENHDDGATMPLLTIHHKTEYRYAHPAAFGEHRIMLRPRDGQRVSADAEAET
jgi:hypothetical protein